MTTPPIPDVPRKPGHLLEQYKACFEDIGRVGERYESSKNFYLSIISALFTFLALSGKENHLFVVDKTLLWLIAVFGVALCLIWIVQTFSVTTLFAIKFHILAEVEEKASLHPAVRQQTAWLADPCLRPAGISRFKFIPVTPVNIGVAILFIILFIALPFLKNG